MNKETIALFLQWIEDGNAHERLDGVWVEQTTQWKKEFTLRQLMRFFVKEYNAVWIF